jgi:hypothetical protein
MTTRTLSGFPWLTATTGKTPFAGLKFMAGILNLGFRSMGVTHRPWWAVRPAAAPFIWQE